MIVRLYNFKKRNNSTKQPNVSYTEYNCVLKNPCSVHNPVIVVDTGDHSTAPAFNYAYIPEFSRYYFIDDMTADGMLWVLTLNVDVLATFKNTIGDWSGYVLRSSAAYNGKISDGYYPGISDYVIDGQTSVKYSNTERYSTPWATSVEDGCFILGMHSQNGAMGNIKYIILKPSEMAKLCAALSNNTVTQQNGFSQIISSIGEAMTKQLVDPLQYIKTAFWIPVAYTVFDIAEAGMLQTGYFTFSVTHKVITDSYGWWKGWLMAIPLNNHPQASRGSYLNDAPYTERYLLAEPFGLIPLNTENLQGFKYICLNFRIDLITCAGDIWVYATNDPQINNVNLANNLVCTHNAMIGVPITMSQAVTDYVGMLAGTAQAIGGALMLSPSEMGGGILNTAAAKHPRISSLGGSGGISRLSGTWRLYSVFTKIADEHLEDVGRPLCAVRKISTIPGYIQLRSGDVPLTGTSLERDEVRSFLESGFFYE